MTRWADNSRFLGLRHRDHQKVELAEFPNVHPQDLRATDGQVAKMTLDEEGYSAQHKRRMACCLEGRGARYGCATKAKTACAE